MRASPRTTDEYSHGRFGDLPAGAGPYSHGRRLSLPETRTGAGCAPGKSGRGYANHRLPSASRRSPGAPKFSRMCYSGCLPGRPAKTHHWSSLASSAIRARDVWKL